MNTKVLRWLAIGCLAATALLAATVASACRIRPAALRPSKAADFSPYVTKDGGISLPTDYREKFCTWAT